jgi:hypothetical protein
MCATRVAFFLFVAISTALAAVSDGTPLDPGREKLLEAERELGISEATRARIAAELQKLRDSEEASPDVIRDYEAYLDRVSHMVAIQRDIVKDMEEAYATRSAFRESPSPGSLDGEKSPRPQSPDEDRYDQLKHLDRELDESLAAFDDMLLREMEAIRLRKTDEMRDLAEEAAAAARRLRDKGIHVDTTSQAGEGKAGQGDENSENRQEASEHASAGREAGEEPGGAQADGDGQGEGGPIPAGGTGQTGKGTVDPGQGGSKGQGQGTDQTASVPAQSYDDDIVARQLREAAERETDPELKKKLWKEYEDYKRGTAEQDEMGD